MDQVPVTQMAMTLCLYAVVLQSADQAAQAMRIRVPILKLTSPCSRSMFEQKWTVIPKRLHQGVIM